MTDLDIVERFARLVGNPSVRPTKKQKPHHKQAWQVQVCGPKARDLMKTIRPMMGIRRGTQIDRAIEYHASRVRDGLARAFLPDSLVRERYESGEHPRSIAASLDCTREAVYKSLRRTKDPLATGKDL